MSNEQWINVKDRLPESILGRYIVCLKNKTVWEMEYSSSTKTWWKVGIGSEYENNKVTHWMPLPEPPTKQVL